ncbi:PPC domain-containing protein [Alkaliphilus transvaalensis]|uniref:PPC domain-containing protein n=1 Tax=Alkaliphilus transvaalensis TaxID=114628 RepID=UPI000478B795|nr:PPC domain-containing protein [Alkaliphilus transvaalensis]
MKKNYFLIFIIIVSISLIGCNKQVFDGSRTSNDKQFLLEYDILNDTKTHNIQLEEGDIIAVFIENISGRLDITVADVDGTEIYRGNNASSGKFNLTIPKTNTYTFIVIGKKAKGSVGFMVTE